MLMESFVYTGMFRQ